ncbi:MAG: carbonic anhydrase [Symplocastrum torsivum CPER-KK1]|uniref:Carbonic anhydrase n=1 Tax=Symplocastrum torsivum CPER-KK1 TaxID=450513 RepID=A0A951PGZ1_9CYAN|nr:carbonic anhydrase [Symplocastrum torsivum CPER-KK1]
MDGKAHHLEDQSVLEHDLELGRVFQTNLTMREVAQLKAPTIQTAEEAILTLKIGNARFFSGTQVPSDFSAVARRAQVITQTPFAVVLGCSDSRVPTEIIYDQRAGDLFVIRVAGNVVEAGTLGSIEYSINHLKTRVVVVMGHEGCGAVQAAMQDEAKRSFESQYIQFLIDRIVPSVSNLPRIRDSKARMREAVIANVRRQVHQLKQNQVVADALQKKEIAVIGAYYEISSGAVDFLESERDLSIDDSEVSE